MHKKLSWFINYLHRPHLLSLNEHLSQYSTGLSLRHGLVFVVHYSRGSNCRIEYTIEIPCKGWDMLVRYYDCETQSLLRGALWWNHVPECPCPITNLGRGCYSTREKPKWLPWSHLMYQNAWVVHDHRDPAGHGGKRGRPEVTGERAWL